MKGKINRQLFLGLALGMIITFVGIWLYTGSPNFSTPKDLASLDTFKKIKQVEGIINDNYTGETDGERLTDYAFSGIVAGLKDDYAAYYTREDYATVKSTRRGTYEGVGIAISDNENNEIEITKVYRDSSAERQGLKEGDIIKEIDGEDYSKKTSADVIDYVGGMNKDSLEILVQRGEKKISATLTLSKIEEETVESKIISPAIGYIKISSFAGVTPKQFKEALTDLEDKKITSLIIDLRDNPGGTLGGVTDTLREILPKGLIYYEVDKKGNRTEELCDGKNKTDLLLTVLVNENTASAAEIFAGAVKDYEMGKIIGVKTYGKGIVQNTFELHDGSAVKITVSHYYTPKGRDIHKVGITPDISVENEEGGEDLQLKKGIEYLEGLQVN